MAYYLAYGSNLHIDQMAQRCPYATPLARCELPGWRLVFKTHADIVPDASASVQGALWEITEECEGALDMYEGVSRDPGRPGYYKKLYLPIKIKKGGKVEETEALVYVMATREWHSMPADSYLRTIRRGYRDFALDAKALEEALGYSKRKVREQSAPKIEFCGKPREEAPTSWRDAWPEDEIEPSEESEQAAVQAYLRKHGAGPGNGAARGYNGYMPPAAPSKPAKASAEAKSNTKGAKLLTAGQ